MCLWNFALKESTLADDSKLSSALQQTFRLFVFSLGQTTNHTSENHSDLEEFQKVFAGGLCEHFRWSVLPPGLSRTSRAVFGAQILFFFSFLPVSPPLQWRHCLFFQVIPLRWFQLSRVHISYRFENNPNHIDLELHYFYTLSSCAKPA